MVLEKHSQRSHYLPVRMLLGLTLVLLTVTTWADDGAYRLQAGDSVSISVIPYPNLSGSFVLDERGQIKLPLIEPLTVSGSTTDEIRSSITERLKEKIDGKVEVSVYVKDYRPIYIDGDVIKPGALRYRPGMTVTIAIALAGGRQSVRASGSPLGLSHEQEQFEQLLDAYRVNVARETRLLAELAGENRVSFPEDFETAAKSNGRVQEILDNERTMMASRLSLQSMQTDALQQRIKGLEQVIRELESQKESIVSRRKLYDEQFEIIRDVAGQGLVPKTALLRLEITVTTLDQEARAADITLIQTRQSLGESRTQLKNLPIERKAEITTALKGVQDFLAQSRIQFDQSSRRLAALNVQAPPEPTPDVDRASERVSITRLTESTGMTTSVFEANWESPVLPGDVIRIPYPAFSAPDAIDIVLPDRPQPSAN